MAIQAPITAADQLWIGEDKTLRIDVKQTDGTTAQTMTGWALTWELLDRSGGEVLLTKTTGAGEIAIGNGDGTDDRASVTIDDVDTEEASLPDGPGNYYHALRRTDAGSEALLSYGGVLLQRASI